MNKLVTSLVSLAFLAGMGVASAVAQENHAAAPAAEHAETPHFPIHHPKETDWSFAGPFGHYDQGQL
jgi:ubiquinol-cytochrome c reductase cytochrome c1 subunit